MNQASMEAADRSAKRGRPARRRRHRSAWARWRCCWPSWPSRGGFRGWSSAGAALADAARAIGGGDLDVAIADPGVRELAPLAEAFRRMVEKLRAYRQSSLGELLAARDLANATVRCLLDPVVVFERDGDGAPGQRGRDAAFGARARRRSPRRPGKGRSATSSARRDEG
jgi:hypothetical protein